MTKYYKYLLALLFAVPVFTSAEATEIAVKRDLRFYCNKSTPIDLFKVLGLYVSPESGYWGDKDGLPLPDKNIFTVKETGKDSDTQYELYFYITSVPPKENDYCGTKVGDCFKLDLGIHIINCRIDLGAGNLDENYYFCYGETKNVDTDESDIDMMDYGKTEITLGDLLFSRFPEANRDMRDEQGNWLPIEVYADSAHTIRQEIGSTYSNGKVYTTNTTDHFLNQYQTNVDTLYLRIIGGEAQQNQIYAAKAVVKVYRKTDEININYDPDIVNNFMKEYEVDDKIKIDIVDKDMYEMYKYYLNRKDLKGIYYNTGADATITIPVLGFNGVEDFIEIMARDVNRCWAKYEKNVTVTVPMPTVFTPDGDGINDILFGGEKFRNREFHLEVFNRWTNRLYSGESGWDGTYQGKPVPSGTYFYTITIRLSDGTKREFRSSVALIRE